MGGAPLSAIWVVWENMPVQGMSTSEKRFTWQNPEGQNEHMDTPRPLHALIPAQLLCSTQTHTCTHSIQGQDWEEWDGQRTTQNNRDCLKGRTAHTYNVWIVVAALARESGDWASGLVHPPILHATLGIISALWTLFCLLFKDFGWTKLSNH